MAHAWDKQVVLVTGASRGIGREVALQCARLGAQVHVCARQVSSLSTLSELPGITAHVCDVRDTAQLDALFAAIQSEHGRLDVLVNNASILGPIGPLAGIDDEPWREAIDINLNGTFFVTRRALPLLEHAHRIPALMINLSSSVGRKARAKWGAYSISKIAVEGLTDLVTAEHDASSLVAVSLNPGGTATQMRAEAYPDEDAASLPTAEEVARTVVLLMHQVGVEQAGAKFSSRALFDVLDQDGITGSSLPRDDA